MCPPSQYSISLFVRLPFSMRCRTKAAKQHEGGDVGFVNLHIPYITPPSTLDDARGNFVILKRYVGKLWRRFEGSVSNV